MRFESQIARERGGDEAHATKAIVLSDFGLKNYGNRLQSYAVIRVLNELGIEAAVVAQFDKPFQWIIRDIIKTLIPKVFWHDKGRYELFRKFAIDNTPYKVVGLSHVQDLCLKNDCAIVGSDQVWSPTYIARWSDPSVFFLPRISADRKIAFSPSIGLSEIPDELESVYRNGLLSFARLSVREEAGRVLIERIAGVQATVLGDPTMAIKSADWRKLANYSLCPPRKYVLTYYLGDGVERVTEKVCDFAYKNGLEIVNLMDKKGPYYQSGPAEFIGLIDRADYFVTDSFHGTVFALHLHTPFNTIRRTDERGSKMFSRIETLANRFDCWSCIVTDNDSELETTGLNWGSIDALMGQERKVILDYMTHELARCGLK